MTDADLEQGRVYPPLKYIRECSVKIASAIAEHVYDESMAAYYPEPPNKEEFIREYLYSTDYECFVPETWDWPQ